MIDDALIGSPDSALPEFHGEAAVTKAYEDAKLRYVRSKTSSAEQRLRDLHAKRLDALNEEIANLRPVFAQRQSAAAASLSAYAARAPHRVVKGLLLLPSFWERLLPWNKIEEHYREAKRCADELDDVRAMLRTRHERIDTLESETRRSIYLREEAVRKNLHTPEGLAALRNDPFVHATFVKMQAMNAERARYSELVRTGAIPPQQARDRDMAERGRLFAFAPLKNVIIGGTVSYGVLSYYVLRDGAENETLLPCDPALEPLRDRVFDIDDSRDGFVAALQRNPDGRPKAVLDHLKTYFSADEAAERYAQHRSLLRANVVTQRTEPENAAQAQLVAVLARLAASAA
jgi:hypothetical protein